MVHLEIQFPDDGFIDVAVLDHATPLADGDDCDSDEDNDDDGSDSDEDDDDSDENHVDDGSDIDENHDDDDSDEEDDDDDDQCIFKGFLRDEPEAGVTLTGGCPFQNSFEVK